MKHFQKYASSADLNLTLTTPCTVSVKKESINQRPDLLPSQTKLKKKTSMKKRDGEMDVDESNR